MYKNKANSLVARVAPFVTDEDRPTKHSLPSDGQGPPITAVLHTVLLMAVTDNGWRQGTSEAINMMGLCKTVAKTKEENNRRQRNNEQEETCLGGWVRRRGGREGGLTKAE